MNIKKAYFREVKEISGMNPVSVIELLCKRLIADIKKGPKAKTNKCERNWSSLPKCCIPSIITTENLCKENGLVLADIKYMLRNITI